MNVSKVDEYNVNKLIYIHRGVKINSDTACRFILKRFLNLWPEKCISICGCDCKQKHALYQSFPKIINILII